MWDKFVAKYRNVIWKRMQNKKGNKQTKVTNIRDILKLR